MRSTLTSLLVAAAALALPQVAQAQTADQRFPVGSPGFESARTVALTHWGANPCGGLYTVTWTPLDPGTNGTASWRNPTDPWRNAPANFDCRIDLNPGVDFDFPKLCTVLTHEIGHLLGHAHDAQQGTLMAAYYTAPLPACAPAAPAPTTAPVSAPDGVDIVARPARKRRTMSERRTRTVRRCVMRKARSGKRVKRCRTVRVKVTAKRAKKAARR